MLLAVWEEMIETQAQVVYWASDRSKPLPRKAAVNFGKLRGLVALVGVTSHSAEAEPPSAAHQPRPPGPPEQRGAAVTPEQPEGDSCGGAFAASTSVWTPAAAPGADVAQYTQRECASRDEDTVSAD